MNGDLQQNLQAQDPADDSQLSALLAKAKRPEAGPYFIRRVLRETNTVSQDLAGFAVLRSLKSWWQDGLPLLRPPRVAAWSGMLATLVICAVSFRATFPDDVNLGIQASSWHSQSGIEGSHSSALMPDRAKIASSLSVKRGPVLLQNEPTFSGSKRDAEVIADLDNLMAREENHLWIDDNAAD